MSNNDVNSQGVNQPEVTAAQRRSVRLMTTRNPLVQTGREASEGSSGSSASARQQEFVQTEELQPRGLEAHEVPVAPPLPPTGSLPVPVVDVPGLLDHLGAMTRQIASLQQEVNMLQSAGGLQEQRQVPGETSLVLQAMQHQLGEQQTHLGSIQREWERQLRELQRANMELSSKLEALGSAQHEQRVQTTASPFAQDTIVPSTGQRGQEFEGTYPFEKPVQPVARRGGSTRHGAGGNGDNSPPSSDDDSSHRSSSRRRDVGRGQRLAQLPQSVENPWLDDSALGRRPDISVVIQSWIKTFSQTLAKRAIRYPGDTRFPTTKAEWIRLVQTLGRDDSRIYDKLDSLFPMAFEGDAYAAMQEVFMSPDYSSMSIDQLWSCATKVCWSEGQRDAIRLSYEDKFFDMYDRTHTLEKYKEEIRSLGTALQKGERELMDQFVRGIRDEKLKEAARFYSMEHGGIDSLSARVQRHMDEFRNKRKNPPNEAQVTSNLSYRTPVAGSGSSKPPLVLGLRKPHGNFRRVGERLQLIDDEEEDPDGPIDEKDLDDLVNEFVNRINERVDMAKIRCYSCGELGHVSRNCPKGSGSKGESSSIGTNPSHPKGRT
jgi:hypothetical protein